MPQDAFERAVTALSRRGESATARVFAARRVLGEGERLRDALAAHARRQSRLSFEPPAACDRDVRRLCRAAREQGHAVDPDAVLAAAVADTRATVLERARAVRDASGLSPSERERRLTSLLDAARAAGFEVTRADVFGEARAERRGASCSDDEGDTAGESRERDRAADADAEQPPEAQPGDARPDVEDAAAALTAIRAWEWGPREDGSASADSPVSGENALARDGGGEERATTQSGGGSTGDVSVPDPETLSSWLVGAGQNRIEDWPC